MTEAPQIDVDLKDTRGRVARLAISAAVGVVIAILSFNVIASVAATPNPDPISKLSGIILGGGLFVASTAVIHLILTRIARHRRGK